jgi:hypothetical protein
MSRLEESSWEAAELTVVPRGESHEEQASRQRKLLVPSVWAALEEGLAHPVGGEVVVRSGDAIGRIYLYKGAIAWVNCSQLRVRLRDTLLANSDINAEELEAALQESQQLRQHFAETLLAWGLIEREKLWECLRIHNARHLGAITQLRQDPQALFVPLVRTYSAGLIFKLEELLEWCETQGSVVTDPQAAEPAKAPAVALPPPSPVPDCALAQARADHAKVAGRLEALLPAGALAAALFDREARHVCGHFFKLPELQSGLEDLTRWLMDVVEGQASGHPPREVLMVAEDTIHVVCRSELGPSLYLWLAFDGSTSVGSALTQTRLVIKSLGQGLLDARPGPA